MTRRPRTWPNRSSRSRAAADLSDLAERHRLQAVVLLGRRDPCALLPGLTRINALLFPFLVVLFPFLQVSLVLRLIGGHSFSRRGTDVRIDLQLEDRQDHQDGEQRDEGEASAPQPVDLRTDEPDHCGSRLPAPKWSSAVNSKKTDSRSARTGVSSKT